MSFLFYLDLVDGLKILEGLKAAYGDGSSAPTAGPSHVSSSTAAAAASKMIKLVKDYEVYVPVTSLRTAISYGKNGKENEWVLHWITGLD